MAFSNDEPAPATPAKSKDMPIGGILALLCRASTVYEDVLRLRLATPIVELRGRLYGITTRHFVTGDDLLSIVAKEFGEKASIAEFKRLMRASPAQLQGFARQLGLYGGALVLVNDKTTRGNSERYFLCSHGQNRARFNTLVHFSVPGRVDIMSESGNAYLDLCSSEGVSLPALVDLGPAPVHSRRSKTSAPAWMEDQRFTKISL